MIQSKIRKKRTRTKVDKANWEQLQQQTVERKKTHAIELLESIETGMTYYDVHRYLRAKKILPTSRFCVESKNDLINGCNLACRYRGDYGDIMVIYKGPCVLDDSHANEIQTWGTLDWIQAPIEFVKVSCIIDTRCLVKDVLQCEPYPEECKY